MTPNGCRPLDMRLIAVGLTPPRRRVRKRRIRRWLRWFAACWGLA